MALPNTSHLDKGGLSRAQSRGFTFFEVLIVLGIVAIILAFGLSIDLNYYKSTLFRSERSVFVSVLERARSRALNNFYESTHGVCYIPPHYVIFRGSDCIDGASTNELIGASSNASFNPANFKVVFEALSARSTPVSIDLTEGGKTSTISINEEGTINW